MSFLIKTLTYTLLLFLILARSVAYATTQSEELLQGLKYSKITTPFKQIVHILQVDPHQLDITAAHAKEQALGRETVTSIAKRYQAIAAINGGFFKMGPTMDGLPAGILKIQGQWYGVAYRSRAAIGWSNHKYPAMINQIQTKTSVHLNHQKFPVHAVNQPPLSKKAILYTDAYGKEVESTPGGYDIVILNNRIQDIKPSGNTPIPKGGYVYSIGAKAITPNHPMDINNAAMVNIEVIPQFLKEHSIAWQMVDNIIGGSPLILFRNRIVHDHSLERLPSTFVMQRHARTAVGILPNGHWLFVVVEQSAFTGSPGMTIPELAVFMEKMECEYALNLDGGGSSTLYVNNNIVNHPVGDKDEDYGLETLRPVSDAILILPKKNNLLNTTTK
jgi:exopolysaccharide biosynthesis protein